VAGTVGLHETYLTNIIKEAEEEIGLFGIAPIEVTKRLYRQPDEDFGRMI